MMDGAHGDIVDSIGINLTADEVAPHDDRARQQGLVSAAMCAGARGRGHIGELG